MKKKGSFLSGLLVFILIIIILGGVGYLGFNIITNANGMSGMNMASSSSTETKSTDSKSKDSTSMKQASNATDATDSTDKDTASTSNTENAYKVSQINQVMLNKEALDKAYDTINAALEKMTLDPYASNSDTNGSISDQMTKQSMSMDNSQSSTQNDTNSDSKSNTTVNVYNGDAQDQSTQNQSMSMGKTYDADKMQQLHSGLYKVSVGMQLLKQLQDDVAKQIEQASVDTSNQTEYYMNQYYKTIASKNKLNNALTYINDAVDLININPYVDANGLVYDSDRMTNLHDSIYTIAQGVVDLNKLNDTLLSQSVSLGSLAQNAYLQSQQNQDSNSMNNMNMPTSSNFNISNIVTIVLIIFVAIFIIGFIGAILNLFKSGTKSNIQ